MKIAPRFRVSKRNTFVLVVCTAVIVYLKMFVNSTVFNMTYSVDRKWWSHLMGNDSSVGKNFTRPSTVLLENIPNPLKAVKREEREGPTFTNVTAIRYATETEQVKNATKPRKRHKYFTKMTKEGHPNENDRLKITSGEFTVEDLMTVGPFRFLKNYKSPCWVHAKGNKNEPAIRCLPFFYLVGAPKSGTTDLHHRLVQHPKVSRRTKKEPHWLSRWHYYSDRTNSNFEDYLNYFTYATREVIFKRDAKGYHSHIFGDCSASTLWDNDYWTILPQFRNLTEPKYTNADYIHHLNPNTKIIVMLRNPVDRLYSDYLFFQHGSPELFHKEVVEIINKTHECLQQHSLRMCLYTPQISYTDVKIKLRVGVYHLHLKEYLRVFPSDQVIVIKLEDFSKNTASYMEKSFAFLGLHELEAEHLQMIANPDIHANQRRANDKKAGEMLPETRRMLEEFYRPHNDLLTELLGDQFDYNRDTAS